MARWLEFLASYEFDIHYRLGISHQNADYDKSGEVINQVILPTSLRKTAF